MTANSIDKRTWTDSELISAVAASKSWRGVVRELGLCVTSAGSIRVLFFILDGDLSMHVIPTRVIAGRVRIGLKSYSEYVVGNIGSLMECAAPACRRTVA
jgi:hypothetical protein